MDQMSTGWSNGEKRILSPDKGCGAGQSILLFWRHRTGKSLTGSQGNELLTGDFGSIGGRGVVIGREFDEDGCIRREISREVLLDLELMVEFSEDGSIGFVYENEMTT